MNEKIKKIIRDIIDENRASGGSSWKEYTDEEIIEVYGYFPSWAVQQTPTKRANR